MQKSPVLFCRSVPVPRPVSLPAQPIALLDDMDAGMPFSSAAAAIQQPRVKDSDQSKKHKKDKHKKESKEKKHKKHKKDKRAKGGGPCAQPRKGKPLLLRKSW